MKTYIKAFIWALFSDQYQPDAKRWYWSLVVSAVALMVALGCLFLIFKV